MVDERLFRILTLDGGGAKGFYSIGVLDEIEQNTGRRISETFDLIYGTSTGAIIAALLARGDGVADVLAVYREHVPQIMRVNNPAQRSAALLGLAKTVFGDTAVADFKVAIGIVATNWKDQRPLIFKSQPKQAHGSVGSFVPFFGVSVADAIVASCSAYPFFSPHTVTKSNGDVVELADGGFCANNPTLYAIADATLPLNRAPQQLRVVSLGVGSYPEPSVVKKAARVLGNVGLLRHWLSAPFLQKVLATNTESMDVLRSILFKAVPTIRIHKAFVEPEMATDLLEYDLEKLNRLVQKGRLSYGENEARLKSFLNY
jgi:uncharacterized protein